MRDEFFVTLFSNSDIQTYPNNSKSKFTCKLPISLDFYNNFDYSVGLIDCTFPRILGNVRNAGHKLDAVNFSSTYKHKSNNNRLEILADIALSNCKNPTMYHKSYFRDFLNIENMRSFENNPNLVQHETRPDYKKGQFLVDIYSIDKSRFRTDEPRQSVIFERDRNYTMNQIVWRICYTYNQILKSAVNDPTLFGKYMIDPNLSDEQILFNAAFLFINELLNQIVISYGTTFEDSDYLLIYSDIIEERIVGNNLSKVLFLTTRNKNAAMEQLDIKNVHYIPVIKKNINEVSFYITDEEGNQIVFEDGKTPTSITLHFKKNV